MVDFQETEKILLYFSFHEARTGRLVRQSNDFEN